MAQEKRYTAKQAAEAVAAKVTELIKNFPALKKYESENSKKLGTQAPHRHQEELDREDIVGKRRVREQQDPRTNPKENAEGNNAAPGARPYNTKKYGMEGQVRKSEELEKSSKNKFGEHVRQHLVDKVHHSMKEHGYHTHEASPNQVSEHARNIGIKNLHSHEIVHASDTYRHEPMEKAELKKDFGANFANAAASGAITPAKIAQGAQSIGQPSATPPPSNVQKSDDMGVSKQAPGNSEAKGEGTTLPRSQAEKNWMDKSEAIAGKNTGVAKLAKFLEIKKSDILKKS
jgi:hypothetical protein